MSRREMRVICLPRDDQFDYAAVGLNPTASPGRLRRHLHTTLQCSAEAKITKSVEQLPYCAAKPRLIESAGIHGAPRFDNAAV